MCPVMEETGGWEHVLQGHLTWFKGGNREIRGDFLEVTSKEQIQERRETVRSLSIVGVGNLRGAVTSTRGP